MTLSNVMKAIEYGIITETTKARLEELEGEVDAEQLRHSQMSCDEVVFGIEWFASLDRMKEGRS